jgi:hypothetical protein
MWEQGLSVSWGMVLMWFSWTSAWVGIVAGWYFDEETLGQAGLMCSALAAAVTVMRDNAKTRRVIRASTRADYLRSI